MKFFGFSMIDIKTRIIENWWIIVSLSAAFYFILQQTLSYGSFDSYNHMLFAKHYDSDWFSLVNEQTGGGLDMSSYPPLVFQLLALLSHVTSYEIAYSLITAIFWFLFSFFASKFFIDYTNSMNVPFHILYLLILMNVGLLKAVFIFGQLTTLVGMAFGFITFNYYQKFLKNGRHGDFVGFLISLALVAFSHHFSLIIVSLILIILTFLHHKYAAKLFSWSILPLVFIFLLLTGITLYPAIFQIFQKNAVPDKEIPHSSRYPLSSTSSYDMWILSTYGLSGIFVLYPIIARRLRLPDYMKLNLNLYIVALLLFVFSLGRSVPFNKFVFGGLEHWLTYDRFSFTSSIFLTFLMAVSIFYILNTRNINNKLSIAILVLIYIGFNVMMFQHAGSIFVGDKGYNNLGYKTNLITDFLNNEANLSYRFQTFGYGIQISKIFLKADNPTLDTNYFTGQKLDWVRREGIAEIDTVKYFGRIDFVDIFMNKTDEYSVKYIIVLDRDFEYYMEKYQWIKIKEKNGITFWENPVDIKPVQKIDEKIGVENYFWGIVPMLSLIFFILLHNQGTYA